MTTHLILFTALFSFACNNQSEKSTISTVKIDSNHAVAADKSRYYITADSIILASPNHDSLIYSRKAFNEIVDHFPTLYPAVPVHPDISYAESGYLKESVSSDGKKTDISFDSEAGQDQYYILFAYFLRQKNQWEGAAARRDTLIAIYQHLNQVFGFLQQGGTYFGHLYNRISGYAEYGIYQYTQNREVYDLVPDITKQKKLYIASLKQLVADHIHNDIAITGEPGKERAISMVEEYIGQLDKLITDLFYLRKAQEFQYSCY